jgi:hypothetical protein
MEVLAAEYATPFRMPATAMSNNSEDAKMRERGA